MNLLSTLLVYMTMVFVSSVQMAPEPSPTPLVTPSSTPVAVVATVKIAATPTATGTPTPTPVPTPAITPNNAYHTLQVGDRGDEVTAMQRRLAELGYYTGNIDGAFGNGTRRAVERFQYNQGLSVDGIAGKRTLTVLYESTEVVSAPTNTPIATTAAPKTPQPTFVPTPSPKPTATPTMSPATAAPNPSPTAEPTSEPKAEESATPAPTEIVLEKLTNVKLTLVGTTQEMTLQSDDALVATDPDLHPLQNGDVVYMPVLEILKNAGNVILPGTTTSTDREIAFSLLKDLYQLSYTLDDANHVSNVEVLKNQQPLLITDRNGFLVDGVLYLPIQSVTDATGITFTLNEAGNQYTVSLPGDETAGA